VPSPNPETGTGTTDELNAIAGTSARADGDTLEDDGSMLSLTEHFNGTDWSLVPSLDPGELPPVLALSSVHDGCAVSSCRTRRGRGRCRGLFRGRRW
jgi:hypothetical protein